MRGGRCDRDGCDDNNAKKWMRGLCQEIESRLVQGTWGYLSQNRMWNWKSFEKTDIQPPTRPYDRPTTRRAPHWPESVSWIGTKQALRGMQTPSLLIKALVEASQPSIAFFQLTYAIPLNTLASDSKTGLSASLLSPSN
jgi:hypothetical protein